MEGYQFALFANNGTDPDLQEEAERNDSDMDMSLYIKKLDDSGLPVDEENEGEAEEPAVQDHYSASWPDGMTSPPLPDVECQKGRTLPTLRHVCPAPFNHQGVSPHRYLPLPSLRISLPAYPRNKLPLAPPKEASKVVRASLAEQQRVAIHHQCCRPPPHPVHGLMYQSSEVLKNHYNHFSRLCFLTALEKN